MIQLRNPSRVLVRIEKGTDAKDDEEHRESVGLEVCQRNGIAGTRVEWLQDSILKVFVWYRTDAR